MATPHLCPVYSAVVQQAEGSLSPSRDGLLNRPEVMANRNSKSEPTAAACLPTAVRRAAADGETINSLRTSRVSRSHQPTALRHVRARAVSWRKELSG